MLPTVWRSIIHCILKSYTYKLQLKLSDGRTKFVEMPLKNYRRIHDGDSASVVLRDGLFGVPVFDHKALRFRKAKRSDRR